MGETKLTYRGLVEPKNIFQVRPQKFRQSNLELNACLYTHVTQICTSHNGVCKIHRHLGTQVA